MQNSSWYDRVKVDTHSSYEEFISSHVNNRGKLIKIIANSHPLINKCNLPEYIF